MFEDNNAALYEILKSGKLIELYHLDELSELQSQTGKSLAAAQAEFTKALHFDWTTVKFIFKKPYFQGNENPFLRGHFQINDETFWFDINFDISMKKQDDGSWTIEDAEITTTKK